MSGSEKNADADVRPKVARLQEMMSNSSFTETSLSLSLKYKFSDELITKVIEAGWDVNFQQNGKRAPLHFAVKRETTVITKKLLEYGANPLVLKANGHSPLHVAIKENRVDQLLELLKWVKEPLDNIICSSNETLLIFALYNESSDDILLTLLNHGCDVNFQDQDGFAALHYCASRESTLVAQKIIENDANINIKNYMEDTPLHSAVLMDHMEYVCMLLYYNASADEPNKRGRTPFHEAIYEELGSEDRPHAAAIARHLLDYVADFEAKNDKGDTVLDTALRKHTSIVPDLLERGFDVNILRCGYYGERVHILYLAWRYCDSYEVLKSFWSRTNFELFVKTEVLLSDNSKTFLEVFCTRSRLNDEQFIQYLYMMFESPYIQDFVCKPVETQCKFIIHFIIFKRNFALKTRLELIWLLLSYDVQIHHNDVCTLYEKHGFDESVELLLMHGCVIHPNPYESFFLLNLLVHRICYDNIDDYIAKSNEDLTDESLTMPDVVVRPACVIKRFLKLENRELTHQKRYCKFYRATFYSRHNRVLNRNGVSGTGELPSLLELSRNVIRKVIYKKWSTPESFQVYQALSKLPVPSVIRDILFLKTPIY